MYKTYNYYTMLVVIRLQRGSYAIRHCQVLNFYKDPLSLHKVIAFYSYTHSQVHRDPVRQASTNHTTVLSLRDVDGDSVCDWGKQQIPGRLFCLGKNLSRI